ncbi:MAG: hypothetical protein ACM3US_11190 [Sphingomonadaceae bacterium]
MARTIGFALGGLMLLDGIKDTIEPRLGFQLWRGGLQRYFPEPVNQMVGEYEKLSPGALRYIAVWEVALAALVLWLASKARA